MKGLQQRKINHRFSFGYIENKHSNIEIILLYLGVLFHVNEKRESFTLYSSSCNDICSLPRHPPLSRLRANRERNHFLEVY